MISFLSGTLAAKTPGTAVVDVGGVGYAVSIPVSTYERIGAVGEIVRVFTHMSVRENAVELFGFSSEQERQLFQRLIEINGVGPKLALSILSGIDPDAFRAAIVAGDANVLAKVHGVGKKTAARLIMELRGSLEDGALFAESGTLGSGPSDPKSEAIQALTGLGLNASEATNMVKAACEAVGDDAPTERIVREALRRL